MKKLAVFLLTLGLMLGTVTVPSFAEVAVDVTVNGEFVKFNDNYGRPYIDKNYRTQVPLRLTMEALGADVSWDNNTRTAIVKKNGITVKVPIGSKTVYVNGKAKQNDTVAVIRNNRTYLPIRIVAESLGADVFWAESARTVVISSGGPSNYEYYGMLLDIYYDWSKKGWPWDYLDYFDPGLGTWTYYESIEDSMFYEMDVPLHAIGYQFLDLDGNGVQELIMGCLNGYDGSGLDNMIIDLYTVDKARNQVFWDSDDIYDEEDHPLKPLIHYDSYEEMFRLLKGNRILYNGTDSSGSYYGGEYILQGMSFKPVKIWSADEENEDYFYTVYPGDTDYYTTQSEIDRIEQEYETKVAKLNLIPLSKFPLGVK